MPEGDTIYRVAARMQDYAVGRAVTAFEDRHGEIAPDVFEGQTLTRAEARGKHLVMHFSGENVMHSHMGMTGAWHVYRTGAPWQKPEKRCRFAVTLGPVQLVLFSPEIIEVLPARLLGRHPMLARLGPDLLSPGVDLAEAQRRLRSHDRVPLGIALMNQQLVAGIGNVYKSELMFMGRLDPFAPVAAVSDEALAALLADARKHMRRNLDGSPRRTRYTTRGPRLWVYNRHRMPCFTCGEAIAMTRQGEAARSTYWCPSCQATEGP